MTIKRNLVRGLTNGFSLCYLDFVNIKELRDDLLLLGFASKFLA